MGSDGTDLDDGYPDFEELAETCFEERGPSKRKLLEPSPEALAEKHVESCLDNGNESVNLM